MKHKDLVIFEKIIKYANKVIDYSYNFSLENFQNDMKTVEACIFNISLIGEEVGNLDKDIINKYTHIKWKAIKDLRNKIVHDYDSVIVDSIWEIITDDIPQLIIDLHMIIENEK